ncbi:GNAT family N-acetyltransferase [Specibacter sp. RAF43]|uniref:GNAT family N-acetyltransferase n=1 Tax=Specibacter sp. RAF43 TaxID=3233057 RepID=UPI003F94FCBC
MTLQQLLLAEYDAQLRCRIPARHAPGVHHELDGDVLRISGRPRGFIETASRLELAGTDLDALIARNRAFFAARGESVEWKTRGHDRPADLPARLVAAGFVPEEPETVMAAPVDRLLPGQDAAAGSLPAGVHLRRVSEYADFAAIAALQSAVWGVELGDTAGDLHADAQADPEGVLVFVAEAHGVVVSAARLELVPGTDFAGLWGGSTLPQWRGRGIYRALLGVRARHAAARGVKYLQVDASGQSAPILARGGFTALTSTTPYVWSPVN